VLHMGQFGHVKPALQLVGVELMLWIHLAFIARSATTGEWSCQFFFGVARGLGVGDCRAY
jgi:hypothetical protein